MDGWIILDKPSGITSAHAVAKVKKLLRSSLRAEGEAIHDVSTGLRRRSAPRNDIKIGHAGTLDPLASGLLPLALGEATKTVAFMMDAAKAYSFTVSWGEERDTDDIEGQPVQSSPRRPGREEIEAVLAQFTGRIRQVPPNYSAIKVEGRRAYDLAREGEAPELKAREVTVNSLEITDYTPQQTAFICHCGKGTYIRSLARDMGRLLGCFGHISRLRRLKVGNFMENHAISLEVLEEMGHKGDLSFLRPVESALDDILAWDINPDQAIRLKRGQSLLSEGYPDNTVMLARCDGKAIAVCNVSNGSVKPVRVFNIE